MPQYIGVGNVAREVSSQYIGVSSVSRQVVGGYIGVSGVARQFFPSGASAITNFAKKQKQYNKINFTWKNPTSNYTGVMIRAKTGSAPTSTSDGTQVYLGAGTNTTSGGTNTSGLVSLSITSRTAVTYYFSCWGYYVLNGKTTYSKTYLTTDGALVCQNCSPNCVNCCNWDCDECYETYCECDKEYWCSCDEIDRCSPWDKANDDCGSVWFECLQGWSPNPGKQWDCNECYDCGNCVNLPDCGNVTY